MRLISYARRRRPKEVSRLEPRLLADHAGGLICLSGCLRGPASRLVLGGDMVGAARVLAELRSWFAAGDLYVELQRQQRREDDYLVRSLVHLARRLDLPLVATGNVHYAAREESRLQDVLVCIRHNVTLAEAACLLRPNSEAFLRSPAEMQALFADLPEAVENTVDIARRCHVSLDFSALAVPEYPLPPGMTVDEHLRQLCERALPAKYGVDLAPARGFKERNHRSPSLRGTGETESPLPPGGRASGTPLVCRTGGRMVMAERA